MVTAEEVGVKSASRVTLVERFRAVLFPIDLLQLFHLLPEHGWIVPSLRPDEQGRIPLEQPPTKGAISLRFDQGNKTLGVGGNIPSDVLEEFRELRQLAKEICQLAPEVTTDYAEFQYTGTMKGRSSPLQTFTRLSEDHQRINKVAGTFQRYLPGRSTKLGLYGVRLAPQGVDANRQQWAELTLSPVNIYGDHHYNFDLLFRDPDVSAAEKIAEHAHEILRDAIRHLEEA